MPSYERVEPDQDHAVEKLSPPPPPVKTRKTVFITVIAVLSVVCLISIIITLLAVLIPAQIGQKMAGVVEIQGHRGCRGLLPENTIPGFLKAIDIGVDVIEMDTVISKDNQVVMSHEPWLSSDYCTGPDGENITSEAVAIEKYAIYDMPYSRIAISNCGHLNAKFPTQTPFRISKPLLSDVIDSVEKYIQQNNKRKVMYNIETKSKPERDGKLNPPIREFCELLYDVIKAKGLISRVTIQSFDIRSLQIFRELDSTISLSLLVEPVDQNYLQIVTNLGFLPHIFSPHYKLLSSEMISYFKSRGVRVIPWTVNEESIMRHAVEMGVDGLITDYPNLARTFMQYPGSN
jgi:glycerophosphoryl diester phosphodiesterase